MHLVYEDTKEEILAVERKAKHQPPHLHQTMEIVYVMKGSLELGVGLELFHMEEGDIGLVFPDVIHHCQVFSEQYSEVLYINIPTRTLGTYEELLKRKNEIDNELRLDDEKSTQIVVEECEEDNIEDSEEYEKEEFLEEEEVYV